MSGLQEIVHRLCLLRSAYEEFTSGCGQHFFKGSQFSQRIVTLSLKTCSHLSIAGSQDKTLKREAQRFGLTWRSFEPLVPGLDPSLPVPGSHSTISILIYSQRGGQHAGFQIANSSQAGRLSPRDGGSS